ncbi:MAG: hypothetical protein R2747_18835 [Pyrinomonadaceae bacterium]
MGMHLTQEEFNYKVVTTQGIFQINYSSTLDDEAIIRLTQIDGWVEPNNSVSDLIEKLEKKLSADNFIEHRKIKKLRFALLDLPRTIIELARLTKQSQTLREFEKYESTDELTSQQKAIFRELLKADIKQSAKRLFDEILIEDSLLQQGGRRRADGWSVGDYIRFYLANEEIKNTIINAEP